MTPPLISARQFGWACLLGAVLALYYGFLRPIRPRTLGDLLFLPAALWGWCYLSFAVCRGDIRVGITLGLLVGFFLFDITLGRWLRPVFSGFWRGFATLWGGFFRLVRNFFKKLWHFRKFFLASGKK